MTNLPVAIANEFLKKPSARGRLTQMQLQKLTYMAHGWNLALNGSPLVSEPAEAWDRGPVYRSLYDHTKFFGSNPLNRLIRRDDNNLARFFMGTEDDEEYVAKLTSKERSIVDRVWKRYGAKDAIELSRLTHLPNTPWRAVYRKGKNVVIEDSLIRSHYLGLARHAA